MSFFTYSVLRAQNVVGHYRIIRLACTVKEQIVHHVSTSTC